MPLAKCGSHAAWVLSPQPLDQLNRTDGEFLCALSRPKLHLKLDGLFVQHCPLQH